MEFAEPDAPSSRQVHDLLHPHRKALTRLRRSEAVSRGDVDDALRQLTELATEILGVARASVWRLVEGGARLACTDLFDARTRVHSEGSELANADCRAYFEALEEERSLAVFDALQDPRTRGIAASYLAPNGIGALLDAPVILHGKMVAVVCHEHVGGPRLFRLWEELVAGTLADLVALAMEAEERSDLQRALEEKERREAVLREGEAGLRAVLDAAPVPLVLARADGQIVLVSPRARDVIGIPPSVAIGDLHASRFYATEEDRDRVLAEVRRSGLVEGVELPMRRWDGELRWCLVSLRTLLYQGAPHVIMGFSEIQAQKDLEDRLRDAATHDALTGAYNRRYFFETAAAEIDRARRYERPVALALLDADRFKEKNDLHGHLVGDELLVALAERTKTALRKTDVLARYGGEELVILFPETGRDEAAKVTERLRKALCEAPIQTSAGPVSVTLSAGVVEWQTPDESLQAFIGRADRAMYLAKERGRNRVELG